jgi:hypothetical protein
MLKRIIRWLNGRAEQRREMRARLRTQAVMDEIRKLHRLVSSQIAAGRREALQRALADGHILENIAEISDNINEADLGPMRYEISSEDLWVLSKTNRKYLAESGARCFNDVNVVSLGAVDGCNQHAIDRIMAWRRGGVLQITMEQADAAIDEQSDESVAAIQKGGN